MAIIDSLSTQVLSSRSLSQSTATAGSQEANGLSGSFADFFSQALSETEAAEAATVAENAALLTGDNANIHSVVLATEKAEVALRLTLQIRNKVLDAYNEIMRMQI